MMDVSHAANQLKPVVALVTNMPSYHQVDLFNAVAARNEISLTVFYLRRLTPGRQWKEMRRIKHDHRFLPEVALPRGLYLTRGLLRALRSTRPSIVVVTQYASTGMQAAMYASALTRTPWIYWSERPRVRFNEQATFNSDAVRDVAVSLALLPLHLRPAAIWGIGTRAVNEYRRFGRPVVNMPYFADLGPQLEMERTEPKEGPLRFLFAGKLVDRKGIDVLLSALQSLVGNWHLQIAGDGPLRDSVESELQRYRKRATYAGFREVDEMLDLYRHTDVLIAPSRYDGWGLVIQEAMAAGIPCIATDQTGAAIDLIRDQQNGWIVPAANVRCLAAIMNRLIADRASVVEAGRHAKEVAREYHAEVGAERFERCLMEAIRA